MILYEYVRWVEGKARNTFNEWRRTLQKAECVLLDEKVNSLRTAGLDTLPGLVAGPIKEKGKKYPHILKMQIGGIFRLRPLLCKGPVAEPPDKAKGQEGASDTSPEEHLTLLLGTREIQNRITPSPDEAVNRREAIIADPKRRQLYRAEKLWPTKSEKS